MQRCWKGRRGTEISKLIPDDPAWVIWGCPTQRLCCKGDKLLMWLLCKTRKPCMNKEERFPGSLRLVQHWILCGGSCLFCRISPFTPLHCHPKVWVYLDQEHQELAWRWDFSQQLYSAVRGKWLPRTGTNSAEDGIPGPGRSLSHRLAQEWATLVSAKSPWVAPPPVEAPGYSTRCALD